MAEQQNSNAPKVEEIKPYTLDSLGQDAVRILARNVDAYKNMSANDVLDSLIKKSIRGAFNAEFESKPKAQFKAKQAVDRKVGDVSQATFSDYRRKLFRDMHDQFMDMLDKLKTYGETLK